MHISRISRRRFFQALGWSLLLCMLIVGIAATLGRASIRLHAALTHPDIALYKLMPEATDHTLLRDDPHRQDLIVETIGGSRYLVILRRGDGQDDGTEDKEQIPWHIDSKELLHE